MFPLFPCLGTNLVSSYPASCQPPLRPSHLGLWGRRHSTSPAALQWSLHRSAPRTPLLHHLSRVPGRGHRRQSPQGLHGWHPAWQLASPRQAAGFAPRRPCRNQAGLVFRPAGLFTFLIQRCPETVPELFSYLARKLFAHSGPAAPSQSPSHRRSTRPINRHCHRG